MEKKSSRCTKCGDPLRCLICDDRKNLDIYNLHEINGKVFCVVVSLTILAIFVDGIWINSVLHTNLLFGIFIGEIFIGFAIIWKK